MSVLFLQKRERPLRFAPLFFCCAQLPRYATNAVARRLGAFAEHFEFCLLVQKHKGQKRHRKQHRVGCNLHCVEGNARHVHGAKPRCKIGKIPKETFARETDKGIHARSCYAEAQRYRNGKNYRNDCFGKVTSNGQFGKPPKAQRNGVPVNNVGNNPRVYPPNARVHGNEREHCGYCHRKPPHVGASGNQNRYHFHVGHNRQRLLAAHYQCRKHCRYAQFESNVFYSFFFHNFCFNTTAFAQSRRTQTHRKRDGFARTGWISVGLNFEVDDCARFHRQFAYADGGGRDFHVAHLVGCYACPRALVLGNAC